MDLFMAKDSGDGAGHGIAEAEMIAANVNRKRVFDFFAVGEAHRARIVRRTAFEHTGFIGETIIFREISFGKGMFGLGGDGEKSRSIEEGGAEGFESFIRESLCLGIFFL